MRKAMVVSQLRTTDVSDPRVIAAMSHVARENFVPAASRNVAYSDRGVQIGDGRALNAPLATGRLLNSAELTKDDKVLLIGAATGYTAAVVAQLAGSVVAVEQSSKLATKAKANLNDLDNVQVEKTDHADGFADQSPYSVIIIDGVVDTIPANLVKQLAPEGRLVGAIMDDGVARLAIGHKVGDTIGYQYFADCGGVTLPGFEQAKSFNF
ncbi:protein-L-isoaspartate O-methyltransferase [Parasphingorhabdus cellanae]|uniref:Protein-L-isoaspartate O-methyltransferase n=2 Tax=Parasphingorhabdus cellanae TaxID=2806553 RepID=A0ABX7T9H8_9SPHN|nr:protein-L-isoaspartate O-methyltransferase [Parasphingorhabdus cellanae]